MEKVVSISDALIKKRAQALLGDRPLFTFQPDDDVDIRLCLRLVPAREGNWIGIVADKAIFTERIRIGMRPKFVVHKDADVPTVCGRAEVRILGRVDRGGNLMADAGIDMNNSVRDLCQATPFLPEDAVVIEVHPLDVQVDDGEGPFHGAIPRT